MKSRKRLVKSLQAFYPIPEKSRNYKYDAPALEVRETKHNGRGVFAASLIPSGTRILKFEGQEFKLQDVPPDSMAMQIEDDLWLCSDGTLLDDCINHSCDPNTGFARNDPVLYALRDIVPQEELSWDYSTSMSKPGWSLVCFCASKHCRRLILPFGDLTSEQQVRVAPISLRYLHNRMRRGS
jgi:SET domain-containing protein